MPDMKESFFVSKMVVFNETFASLKSDKSHYSVIWNEATRGRSASDVTSAYVKIISNARDQSHFIFWADNCTAQNKNWTLYSTFARMVNQESGPQEIIMKYLVPGHTFFAPDGLHGRIEQTIRKRKNLYDMRDLIESVEQSASRMEVIQLNIADFVTYENLVKLRKVKTRSTQHNQEDEIPHIQNICQAVYKRV